MSSWQPKAHHAKQSQMLLCSQWCSCRLLCVCDQSEVLPSPLLDNIRVMVIVWRLGGNIIRTTLCWIDDQLISFSALTLLVWSSIGHLACKNRPRNDLLCVKWDVKPTHSLTDAVWWYETFLTLYFFTNENRFVDLRAALPDEPVRGTYPVLFERRPVYMVTKYEKDSANYSPHFFQRSR